MQVIRGDTRGHSQAEWLDSWHSFSFAGWFDPDRVRVGPLRVLNDDRVAGGGGFGAHPHANMEIVTYVLEGALAHRDSAGNGGVIRAGGSQFMRAGRGVVHSEMNASETEPVHFLQIWLIPRTKALEPAYDERAVKLADDGSWSDIAGGEGFAVDADAGMRVARVLTGKTASATIAPGRRGYLYVIDGKVTIGEESLRAGDAALFDAGAFDALARSPAHLLLFDLGSE